MLCQSGESPSDASWCPSGTPAGSALESVGRPAVSGRSCQHDHPVVPLDDGSNLDVAGDHREVREHNRTGREDWLVDGFECRHFSGSPVGFMGFLVLEDKDVDELGGILGILPAGVEPGSPFVSLHVVHKFFDGRFDQLDGIGLNLVLS